MQHSQTNDDWAFASGAAFIGVIWALKAAYSTYYNTITRQFNNLVIKSATASEHNTNNHIADLLKHADELTNSTDKKEKIAIMEETIKCMHGNNTKNAKATKECIDLARKTVKGRKEIAEKHG